MIKLHRTSALGRVTIVDLSPDGPVVREWRAAGHVAPRPVAYQARHRAPVWAVRLWLKLRRAG